jgi:hypothetical protein
MNIEQKSACNVSQNLNATVFVFESVSKPYKTRAVYINETNKYINNSKWKHTATIDPAKWIESLMNHSEKERNLQVENICYRGKYNQ